MPSSYDCDEVYPLLTTNNRVSKYDTLGSEVVPYSLVDSDYREPQPRLQSNFWMEYFFCVGLVVIFAYYLWVIFLVGLLLWASAMELMPGST